MQCYKRLQNCAFIGAQRALGFLKKKTEKKKEELGLLETRASPIGIGGY